MLNHPYSLFELGVALTDQASWLSRLGRLLETEDYVFAPAEEQAEIVEGVGRLKFLVMQNDWGQEWSLPLGFDCYSGKKLLHQVAQMGPWTHDEVSEGISYYLSGDDVMSAHAWDSCALTGVPSCALNSIWLNEMYLDDPDVDSRLHVRDLRLMLANDDDIESVGWLADCFWGEGGGEEDFACEQDRELAWKLYKEADLLGDDKSAFEMAVMWWRGSVPGKEKNATKSLEILDTLIERGGEGQMSAWLTKIAISVYEFSLGCWRWYCSAVGRVLLGKGEEAADGGGLLVEL